MKLECRYCVAEDINGGLFIHQVPGAVCKATVRLHRNMPQAQGKAQVVRCWWDAQPRTPEEACTRWRNEMLEAVEGLERQIKYRKAQIGEMDRSRDKIIQRFKDAAARREAAGR